GWGKDRHSESVLPGPALILPEINAQGWLFGGHAGFNWQYNMLVAGLEVDMTATDIKGDVSASAVTTTGIPPVTSTSTSSRSLSFDYLATARARVGVAFGQYFLLYGTGGPAWAKMTQDFASTQNGLINFVFNSSTPSTTFGVALGVGGEASLAGFG